MNAQTMSIAIFIAAYVLFIFLPTRRAWVAMGGTLLLLATGTLTPLQAFGAINWNVMGLFIGMLVVADIFMESRVPAYLAELLVDQAPNTAWAILLICMLTGFISAFVENVATVLIIAPLAFSLADKLKFNPVAMMIGIAISSNLQGAATLIGDPPSMLLGGFAKMTFMDFFFYHGKPSIFFAVELGALSSFFVLFYIFRQHREKVPLVPVETVRTWFPTVLLAGLIVALALSSFFDSGFSYAAGILCMVAAVIALVWEKFLQRRPVGPLVKRLDWDTTLFLVGVFVLVGGLTGTGWIDSITSVLAGLVGDNVFLAYTLLVFISVAVSAVVDNVPFLVAMLPIAIELSAKLGIQPSLLLFGILIGASLGGNITPIGASANIVACGLLKKQGHHVSFGQFMKIGIPFTIAAVIPAYLFVWFVWK
jgi:Na+/H+ antiporter NhaD/arsenite permease-like protein